MGLFRRRQRVAGHATIVEAWRPNRGGHSGNCRMKPDLDEVPGVPRQVVDHHELFMVANRWPEAGMRVAVSVDPGDPGDVEVDRESVFGEVAGGKLGVAAELVASAAGVDLDLSKGPERPAPDGKLPDDRIPARIAELNARFARGEITDEEMSAQIQRALGASG